MVGEYARSPATRGIRAAAGHRKLSLGGPQREYRHLLRHRSEWPHHRVPSLASRRRPESLCAAHDPGDLLYTVWRLHLQARCCADDPLIRVASFYPDQKEDTSCITPCISAMKETASR